MSTANTHTLLIVAAFLAMTGCRPEEQTHNEPAHAQAETHNHASDQQCTEHDHHQQNPRPNITTEHAHTGELIDLGTIAIDGYHLTAIQIGHPADGISELVFQLIIDGQPEPSALRLLVRTPSGEESMKVKAEREKAGKYFAHVVELPQSLPRETKLLIELEITPDNSHKVELPLAFE